MLRAGRWALLFAAVIAGAVIGLRSSGRDWQAELHRHRYAGTAVSDAGAVPDPSTMTLKFKRNELTVTGGCNAATGMYAIVDGRLRFTSGLRTTEKSCAGETADAWLLALLDEPGAEIDLAGGTGSMTLTHGNRSATFGLMGLAGGPAPLEGPEWNATGYLDGQGGLTTFDGIEPPTIRIEGAQARIFTGCNDATASVKILVRRAHFSAFTATTQRTCTGEAGRADGMVRELFSGDVAYSFGNVRNVAFAKPRALAINFVRE